MTITESIDALEVEITKLTDGVIPNAVAAFQRLGTLIVENAAIPQRVMELGNKVIEKADALAAAIPANTPVE